MSLQEITLNVEGMSCSHCSGTVQKALESINGLSGINVDLKGKKA
ncbi:MAG: heavy-metal-associated domain-containing protein, partial [Desulfamplus sp.]|nr:heavy-metal-associated domain-containing protein [Desulfamplus sp.]